MPFHFVKRTSFSLECCYLGEGIACKITHAHLVSNSMYMKAFCASRTASLGDSEGNPAQNTLQPS